MNTEPFAVASRLLLAVILFWSGIGKIVWPAPDPTQLLVAVGLRRTALLQMSTRALPYFELAVALSLVIGWWTAALAFLWLLLLTFFTFVLWYAMKKGYREGCSCFGYRPGDRIGRRDILFNCTLIVAASFLSFASEWDILVPFWRLETTELLKAVFIVIPFLVARLVMTETKHLER